MPNAPIDEVARFAALYDRVNRPPRDLTPAGRSAMKNSKYACDIRTLNPSHTRDRRNLRSEIGVDGPRSVDNDEFLQRAVTRQRNRAIVGMRNPDVEDTHKPAFRLEYMANVCALEEEDRIDSTAVANRILDSKSTVADALHRHGDNAMRRRNLEDNLAQWQTQMTDTMTTDRLETLAREEEMEREGQESATASAEVETMEGAFKDSFHRLSELNFFVERVVTEAKHNYDTRGAFRRPTKTIGTATELTFFSGIKAPTTSVLDHSDDDGEADVDGGALLTSAVRGDRFPSPTPASSPKDGKMASVLEGYETKINELQGRLGRRTEALINALKMVEAVEKQHKRHDRHSERAIRSKDDEMLRLRMYIEALETGIGFTQRWEWRGEAEDDEASATKSIATAMQIARDEAKKEHQRAMNIKQREALEASRRREIINYVEHEDSAVQLRDQMDALEKACSQLRGELGAAEATVEKQSNSLAKADAELTVARTKLLVAESELATSTNAMDALRLRNVELEIALQEAKAAQEGTQLDVQELLDERDEEVARLRRTVADLSQGLHVSSLEQEISDLKAAVKQRVTEAADLRERNATVKKLNSALEARIRELEGNETQKMETVCQAASTILRSVSEGRAVISKKVPPLVLESRPVSGVASYEPSTPNSPQLNLPKSPTLSGGGESNRILVADRKQAMSVLRFHFVSQNRLWELSNSMADELESLVRTVAGPLIQPPPEDAPCIDGASGERLPDTTAGRMVRDACCLHNQLSPPHFGQVESLLRVIVDDTPLSTITAPVTPQMAPLELSPPIAIAPSLTVSETSESELGSLLPTWADDLMQLQAIVTKVARLLQLRGPTGPTATSASNALWALRSMSASLSSEVAAPIYRLRQEDARAVDSVIAGPTGPINVDSHLHQVLVEIPRQVSRCLFRKVAESVRARRGLLNKCRQAEARVAMASARLRDASYLARQGGGSVNSQATLEALVSVAHVSVRSLVQGYISTFPSRGGGQGSRSARPMSAIKGPSRVVTETLLNMGRTLEELREAQDMFGAKGGVGGAWLRWFDIDRQLNPPQESMLLSSEDGTICNLHRTRLRLIGELQGIDDVDTRFIAKQTRRNRAVLDALGGRTSPSAADKPSSPTAYVQPAETIVHVVTAGVEEKPNVEPLVEPLPRDAEPSTKAPRDNASILGASAVHTAPGSRSSSLGGSPPSTGWSEEERDPKEAPASTALTRTTSFPSANQRPPVALPAQADHPAVASVAAAINEQLVAAVVREAINQATAAVLEGPHGLHAPFDLSRGVEVRAVLQRARKSSSDFEVNLQRADDAVAQIYPKLAAAVTRQVNKSHVEQLSRQRSAPSVSVSTQCEFAPPVETPWSRGKELAERIVSRNRPTSATTHRERPSSATNRHDVFADVVDTLVPTFSAVVHPTLDHNPDVGDSRTSSHATPPPAPEDEPPSMTALSPPPHSDVSATKSAEEISHLTEENHVLAVHVQSLQQHIAEVKRNLKTFLQQAVTENIMRPLPNGTWARQSELTFIEAPHNKSAERQRVDLVVSDPMKFTLHRESTDDSGIVLRGASGRPLFVPRRIPNEALLTNEDFYPSTSQPSRPPSSGGYPLLQQQVLRHIAERAPRAVADVAVETDKSEQPHPTEVWGRGDATADAVCPEPSLVSSGPPAASKVSLTISTQTPDELLNLYVMRMTAGLSASSKTRKPSMGSARQSAASEPASSVPLPAGILLRPVTPSQGRGPERAWTTTNPVALSPHRVVSHHTFPEGIIPVPLGSHRTNTPTAQRAVSRVNCPPVFASRGSDQEAVTGPFSERQITLYPPHRHWSDHTDDALESPM